MSSARFTAALYVPPPPEVEIPDVELTATSSASFAAGGIYTLAARGGPPRRALLWVRNLDGEQIGVVS